jgi:hypothetical protein
MPLLELNDKILENDKILGFNELMDFKVELPIWALQMGLWTLYCKALNPAHHVK